jgi:hypothetical protein
MRTWPNGILYHFIKLLAGFNCSSILVVAINHRHIDNLIRIHTKLEHPLKQFFLLLIP